MEIIKTGKFERALSLMNRLHLEKSFDIAIDSSDRMGHRKLSDKIEEMKLQRFPAVDEDDFFDDNNSLGSREKSGSNDEASVTSERVGHRAVRGISPEIHTPNARRSSRDDDASESTREESPPKASLKRKFEDNAAASTTAKRRNPFAKVSHAVSSRCRSSFCNLTSPLFVENIGKSSQRYNEDSTQPRKADIVETVHFQHQVSSKAAKWQANHVDFCLNDCAAIFVLRWLCF